MTARQEFPLNSYEEVTAVAAVDLELHDLTNSYFAVGSVYLDDAEKEPNSGRLLIFSRKHQQFRLISSSETQGSIYALASVRGRLVAAINTSVSFPHCSKFPAELTKSFRS